MADRIKSKQIGKRAGVFISYARSDGKAFAAGLRSQLEEKGFPLWQDVIAMEGGRDWWLQITDALDHVEFMALIITPNALKSDTVRKEWRYAREQGVCVYPIKGSPDLDFGSMPRWMREKHFYDLDAPLQLARFLNDLNTRCEEPRVPFMAEPLPPDFVPRPGEFNQLLSLLLEGESGDPVAITAALRGAGGYGKTTLAKALCHDEEVQNAFDGGILWVTLGESPGDLTRRVIDLIEVLTGGARPGFSDVNAATARLRELLADRNALLVIDDVWDSVHLTPFTQGVGRGARLITTRIIDVLPLNATRVQVDAMSQAEAVALLRAGLPPGTPGTERDLRELAARLGEWPLLLKLANGVLRHRVNDLKQSLTDALRWANTALDKRGLTAFDARDPKAREQAVKKTLGVSIDLLDKNERARYGELAIFPEDVDIPLATLAKLWSRTAGLDEFEAEELCERLDRLSLLQRFDPNSRVIRLHDVVRNYLIGEMGDNLPAVHSALLDAHRPSSVGQTPGPAASEWTELPLDGPYLWDYLAYHLLGAGRREELIATVKELCYLAAKTFARNALAAEADLLAAEDVAAEDGTLQVLRRSFVQSAHVLNRCEKLEDIEATLFSRLNHLGELVPLTRRLVRAMATPYLIPWAPIPDLSHSALVRTLSHEELVEDCPFSPDGSFIVSAGDQTLKVWDVRTGAERFTLLGHASYVQSCAISPDSSFIVSTSLDNTLKVWDSNSGAERLTLCGHKERVTGCAISPDGTFIVSASWDGSLKVWDSVTGTERLTLLGHRKGVNACSVSPDGTFIVSASLDCTLIVWDAVSGAQRRKLSGHDSGVEDCAVSPDSTFIVSASDDGTLKIWNARTGAIRSTLSGHDDAVSGCAISPEGSFVVSGSNDRTLKIWDSQSGATVATLSGHSYGVHKCHISSDGRLVATTSDDAVKIWDVKSIRDSADLPGHSSWVRNCATSKDGAIVLSASDDALVLWDSETGTARRTLFHGAWISGCALSADGSVIVSGLPDETVGVCDLRNAGELRKLTGHKDRVTGCAISGDGTLIVSASDDKTLIGWDAVRGTKRLTLHGHKGSVNCCAISHDGTFVVSASSDKSLKVWSTRGGRSRRTLRGHDAPVHGCAISPDDSFIVSASDDETVTIWNSKTGEEIRTLIGHWSDVRGCAISTDCSLVASASYDYSLKVWDVSTGNCLTTFHAEGPLSDCVWLPNSDRLVAVGALGVYFLQLVR